MSSFNNVSNYQIICNKNNNLTPLVKINGLVTSEISEKFLTYLDVGKEIHNLIIDYVFVLDDMIYIMSQIDRNFVNKINTLVDFYNEENEIKRDSSGIYNTNSLKAWFKKRGILFRQDKWSKKEYYTRIFGVDIRAVNQFDKQNVALSDIIKNQNKCNVSENNNLVSYLFKILVNQIKQEQEQKKNEKRKYFSMYCKISSFLDVWDIPLPRILDDIDHNGLSSVEKYPLDLLEELYLSLQRIDECIQKEVNHCNLLEERYNETLK